MCLGIYLDVVEPGTRPGRRRGRRRPAESGHPQLQARGSIAATAAGAEPRRADRGPPGARPVRARRGWPSLVRAPTRTPPTRERCDGGARRHRRRPEPVARVVPARGCCGRVGAARRRRRRCYRGEPQSGRRASAAGRRARSTATRAGRLSGALPAPSRRPRCAAQDELAARADRGQPEPPVAARGRAPGSTYSTRSGGRRRRKRLQRPWPALRVRGLAARRAG